MSAVHDVAETDPAEGIRLITLARPSARNALRHQTMAELADALECADGDTSIRCVILAGDAKAFAAGADVAEMLALDGPALESHPRTLAWQRIWRVGVPLIAAVEGVALGGGCELVLSCDIAIAGEGARFGQPEITLGWMPGAGGTQRLPRTVGKSAAMQMVLTGDIIDASTALQRGLVSEMVPHGAALSRALEIAARITAHPREATRLAKSAILRAYDLPLADGLRREHDAFRHLASSPERAARMQSFLDRTAR